MELFDIACGDVAWVEDLPPQDGDEHDALYNIYIAHGIISEYIEKAEHLPPESQLRLPKEDLADAPAKLHLAASILARLHKVDLIESQRRRIREQSDLDPSGDF